MTIKFLKRNIFQRILGLPATGKARNPDCWHFKNGQLTVDLKKLPEIQAPGNAVRLEGKNLPVRLLLLRGEDKELYLFKNRCAHLGHRRLDPVPGTDTVQCCSINKSTYRLSGERIHGPAPHDISSYAVAVEGDTLTAEITA